MELTPLESIDLGMLGKGAFIGTNLDHLSCYFGFRPPTIQAGLFCYSLSVGFKDKHNEYSNFFIKLVNGALIWAYKPESSFGQCYFAPDYYLSLPSGTQCYYSVNSHNYEEDKRYTEMAFGFIQSDLEELVSAYCKVMEITGYRKGRITFSKTRDNNCDLTGVTIPREFPYITFAESSYIWSHVSLYGFYCHLAFLLSQGRNSPLYELLVDAGAKVEWLERVKVIPTETMGSQIILHGF